MGKGAGCRDELLIIGGGSPTAYFGNNNSSHEIGCHERDSGGLYVYLFFFRC
jgi:hypothetical protein